MNAASETLATPVAAPVATRSFYWLVRRELWESRAVIIAPLAAAAVLMFAFCFAAYHTAHTAEVAVVPSPEQLRRMMMTIFTIISLLIGTVATVTGWFYCLDALHSERRDRSVLFWKSMPISDTATVLSKLFVPMVIVPAIAIAVTVITQFLVLVLGSVTALSIGHEAGPVWSSAQPLQQLVVVIYGEIVASLWYAPVTAWLLLVSSWAKRSLFLWAVLPPLAIVVFERIALRTSHAAELFGYRLQGGLMAGFQFRGGRTPQVINGEIHLNRAAMPDNAIEMLDPARFFSNPHLWIGLVAAGLLIVAAIWMRRYREPL